MPNSPKLKDMPGEPIQPVSTGKTVNFAALAQQPIAGTWQKKSVPVHGSSPPADFIPADEILNP